MTTIETVRRSLVLRRRPDGEPRSEDFSMVEDPIPAPGAGEVLTRTLLLSIDPYMRGRISGRASYTPPVAIGGVMTGESVGEVLASGDKGFAAGDIVVGSRGWQTHSLSKASALTRVDRNAVPLGAWLGVLGMPGTTAYSGMTDIGQPTAGETVVVSAASGAVGSVAGQLAKRVGCRVVGIAGGPAKCMWVQEALGFDDCVDHRSGDLPRALREACPNGIDVYFENVGGLVQEAAFGLLNAHARVVMCGMIAQYNAAEFPAGPNLGFVVGKRVRIEGLIVSDKPERFAEWRALATPWLRDGSLKHRQTIVDGLENAPEALRQVLTGDNFGKMLVRVG
jgi:NADPH-dependent curcumin reductase CurA